MISIDLGRRSRGDLVGARAADERVCLEDEDSLGGGAAPQPVRAHELVVRRVGQVVHLQTEKKRLLQE